MKELDGKQEKKYILSSKDQGQEGSPKWQNQRKSVLQT
jgi:hypothetical protein